MIIVRDDLWLCEDCMIFAVNGDATGIDDSTRELAVVEGVGELGPHLVPSFDSETGDGCEEEIGVWCTRQPCDACGSRLHGSRHRFAILGEEHDA